MTWEAGSPLAADKFELEAALRRVGMGGVCACVGVGPLDVAVEFGIGRRPLGGFSDMLR